MQNVNENAVCLTFQDPHLLPQLFGEDDRHIHTIEQTLGLSLSSRGNTIAISGPSPQAQIAETVLKDLYQKIKSGMEVGEGEIHALIRMAQKQKPAQGSAGAKSVGFALVPDVVIRTQRKHITPFSHQQKAYMEALMTRELVMGSGPAGTGKTYLAVAAAASFLLEGKVERIILSRPAVEAGEKLGFLPGDMREKVDPYLRPIYDALYSMIPPERVQKHIETGAIEIAPLAFMRGRTLKHSFVILDEAQNTTPTQMKMFLTRLGDHSRMVVTGDLTQMDLPTGMPSGFDDAIRRLSHLKDISIIHFSAEDVVRHPLTQKIVEAYEKEPPI